MPHYWWWAAASSEKLGLWLSHNCEIKQPQLFQSSNYPAESAKKGFFCLRRCPGMFQSCETNWFTDSLVAEVHSSFWFCLFSPSFQKNDEKSSKLHGNSLRCGIGIAMAFMPRLYHHLLSFTQGLGSKPQHSFLISVKCGSQNLVLVI